MSDGVLSTIAQGYNPLMQMNNVIGFQRQQTALQQQRFDLQQAQLGPAYAGLMALRTNPNATWDDVNAALANSQRLGGNTDGMVANMGAAAARGESPADFIRNESLRGVPSFEQLQAVTPGTEAVPTGAGMQFGTVGARGGPSPGQFTPTQFVPSQMSVADLAKPAQWTDEQGVAHTGTMADWYRFRGVDPSTLVAGQPPPVISGQGANYGLPGGSMGAGGSNIPGAGGLGAIKEQALMNVMLRESGGQNIPNAQGSPAQGYFQIMPPQWQEGASLAGVDTKQYPNPMSAPFPVQYQVASALYDKHGTAPWAASAANAGQFPGAQAAASAARGVAGGGGGVVTMPAAGGGVPVGGGGTNVAPSRDVMPLPGPTLEGGQSAYAADTAMQRSLGQRISPLENALSVLRANPNLATGPGQAQFANAATAITQSLGLPTPNQATAYQELSKYLTQYMRNMPGANRSDLAQLEAQAASPNPEQSRPAMETLLAKAVGYERMQTAPLDWFNQQYRSTGDAARNSGQYLLRASNWAKTQDPVAYAVDEMTPEMYRSYAQGLSPAARNRLINSRAEAIKLYPWLTVGGAGAPAAPAPAAAPASAAGT